MPQATPIPSACGGLQGIAHRFCGQEKINRVAALLAAPSEKENNNASTSGLETSVLEYGQHWDFRENLWRQSPELECWLLEEEPAQLAADLLNSDKIWLLRDQTYFKPPGSEHTPWHQDALFIPVEGCDFLTLWIPITPILNQSDSPLEYWQPPNPSCHFLQGGSAIDSFHGYQQVWQREDWQHISTLGLQPGDCSYHDGWTVHGSEGHHADVDRLAFVAVYGCGEGTLSLAPSMGHAPSSLRSQVQLLRQGLHQSCFQGLMEGDPVPGHHNPWIRCCPNRTLPIHSTDRFSAENT